MDDLTRIEAAGELGQWNCRISDIRLCRNSHGKNFAALIVELGTKRRNFTRSVGLMTLALGVVGARAEAAAPRSSMRGALQSSQIATLE